MKSQGLQANQQVTFLSDGADDVRELPLYLSPESEHWLDWFHVAMRLRVMGQMAKGLVNEQNMMSAQEPLTEAGEELGTVDIGKQLERVKWFLSHGNMVRALIRSKTLKTNWISYPRTARAEKSLEGRAKISRLYRSQPKLHPKLWGSLPARREDFNGLRGVRGEIKW